jgi:biopolymer transport protein ExbB/TolQ
MMEFFISGGYVMWVLLVSGILVVGLAATAARRLASADEAARRDAGVDAVLFWGVFSVVVGLIGTFIGIGQAARAIELAGAVEPALAWSAIRVALTTTIAGLAIGTVALVLWFVLRSRQQRLVTAGGGA